MLALLFVSSTVSAQLTMSVSQPLLDEYPIVKLPLQIRDNASIVNNLSLSYFSISENGTVHQPMFLDCDTDTSWESLSFLYVLDVSLSMKYEFGKKLYDPDLKKWKSAIEAFTIAIDAIRPGDGGTLYALSMNPECIVPFTTVKDELKAGLNGLIFRNGTAIYDTILRVLRDAETLSGRRVMILLTDGEDYKSFAPKEEAIALAEQMGIPIYIIGLDVAPNLNDTLRYISQRTGGEYSYAPTAEELQVVMFNIAENILTKDCLLAFRTDDTCRDGRVREIEVSASVPPYTERAETEYSLPYDPDFVIMSVGVPGLEIEDDGAISLDFNVSGPLRKDRLLKIVTNIAFDPEILEFHGIDSSLGISSLVNPTITVNQSEPGTVLFGCNRITLHEDVAPGEEKPLFHFLFNVLHQDSTIVSQIELSNTGISQHCPIAPLVRDVPFTVLGCPQMIIGIDTNTIAFGGKEFIIPLRMISPSRDIGSQLEYAFTIRYDAELIDFKRPLVEGTVSQRLDIEVQETQPGTLQIIGHQGIPETANNDLLRLVFEAQNRRDATEVALMIQNGTVIHTCTPVMELVGTSILLDGDCGKIVRRRDFYLGQNAPNPVQKGVSAGTEIPYNAIEGSPVLLQVFDIDGKPIATLVNSTVEGGRHTVRFDPGRLPAGVYFYTLTQGDNVWTRKMILTE